MCLDSVELQMDVEEEFGITIGDADVEKLVTVADLHECILRKLGGTAHTGGGTETGAVWGDFPGFWWRGYALDPAEVRALRQELQRIVGSTELVHRRAVVAQSPRSLTKACRGRRAVHDFSRSDFSAHPALRKLGR